MKDSIILQVDETTKELIDHVQSSISDDLKEKIEEVRKDVGNVDDNTAQILRKFQHFDSLGSSLEQLQQLASESKQFANMVSPLQESIREIQVGNSSSSELLHVHTNCLDNIKKSLDEVQKVHGEAYSQLKEKNEELSQRLQLVGSKAEEEKRSIVEEIGSAHQQISQVLDSIVEHQTKMQRALLEKLSELESLDTSLCKAFEDERMRQHEFEDFATNRINELSTSVGKIQATLGIIVNLVTPFWKKWNK